MIFAAGLIGGFYMFAGLVIFRAVAMDRLLDQAIESISLKATDPQENRDQRRMLLLGGLTFAGGLALATLSRWAVPLFLIGLAAQALLLWHNREDREQDGPNKSVNAALIYAVMTMFVLYAAWSGTFRPWFGMTPPVSLAVELAAIAALTGVAAAYFLLRGRLDKD